MSVTAASGFTAAGVAAGLKGFGKRDLALVVNEGPLRSAAAVFTSNRAKANPVLWSQQVMSDGTVSAIILNSGGANCFTGSEDSRPRTPPPRLSPRRSRSRPATCSCARRGSSASSSIARSSSRARTRRRWRVTSAGAHTPPRPS
ncbi:hypothetical protein GCM10025869_34110 [Homoserinibacter gongjuensis]|uniref:Uncharacterized protein n=1 Tax=Homoserinibacter gongjuensis TaxID=1162968 RepID=A0ABQ6K1T4_9MICO|nr:hypothetical protein GCM10025869_34110 [Homoserinibacter gongjuensis]